MFFFFFKQKTAYEMRISDWSSDVCSSDLQDAIGRQAGAKDRVGDEGLAALHDEEADEHGGAEEDPHHHGGRLQGGDRRFLHGGPGQPPMQTGDEDRQRVVEGKSVSVRVDTGGRRIIKKNNKKKKG